MTLEEQINQDIAAAMKAQEKARLEALRAIKSAILVEKTSGAHKDTLTADVEMKLLQRQLKQRQDAAELYANAGRQELADKELAEAEVIKAYLPKMLSEDELRIELQRIMTEVGASSPADMGKVMGVATKQLAGKADGKAISTLVKAMLAK